MPEFILPDEADHCAHCGAVLYDNPKCCEKAEEEYLAYRERISTLLAKDNPEDMYW